MSYIISLVTYIFGPKTGTDQLFVEKTNIVDKIGNAGTVDYVFLSISGNTLEKPPVVDHGAAVDFGVWCVSPWAKLS